MLTSDHGLKNLLKKLLKYLRL